jgi:hypothetical protein
LILIRDQDTRWFLVYLILVQAVEIYSSIDSFVIRFREPKTREKDLSAHVITPDDWAYCKDILSFIRLLYYLVKELERKAIDSKLFITLLLLF